MNVIDAAIDNRVKKVVALSTDKASSPINLYGASKLASDKLFVASNSYAGRDETQFSVVRYGNVMGSRGSIIPFLLSLKSETVPITDLRMTRFMITLDQGVELVWQAFHDMLGGEIYVKKIPSMSVVDIANCICPGKSHEVVGIRPGEKIHEQMIGVDDAPYTYEYDNYYKILPNLYNSGHDKKRIKDGKLVPLEFSYSSEKNSDTMTCEQLSAWIKKYLKETGKAI